MFDIRKTSWGFLNRDLPVIFMAGRIWEKWEKWFNISERAKWSKCPSISSSFMGEWVIACLLPDQDQGRHIHHLSGCDPKLYIPKYYKNMLMIWHKKWVWPKKVDFTAKIDSYLTFMVINILLRTIKCTKTLNFISVLTVKIWKIFSTAQSIQKQQN